MSTDHNLLIDEFAHGIDTGRITVMAVGSKFVLFHIASHTYWADMMNPRVYAPVQYVLIRRGQWWMRATEKKEWEGRTTRSVLMAAFNEAERTGRIADVKA